MDLWIRSQDKEKLVLTKGFKTQYNNYDCGCQIFAVWENDYQMVGKYKNKERALEVLDEIQSCIQTNAGFEMYSNLGQFSDDFNKKYNLVPVYLMPKE